MNNYRLNSKNMTLYSHLLLALIAVILNQETLPI